MAKSFINGYITLPLSRAYAARLIEEAGRVAVAVTARDIVQGWKAAYEYEKGKLFNRIFGRAKRFPAYDEWLGGYLSRPVYPTESTTYTFRDQFRSRILDQIDRYADTAKAISYQAELGGEVYVSLSDFTSLSNLVSFKKEKPARFDEMWADWKTVAKTLKVKEE